MGIQLRVLIVEDREDDVLLLIRALKREGYDPEYVCVENAVCMNEALTKQSWDIVISDYNMPHFNGLEALEILKGKDIDIPFILLSGAISEEIAVDAMTAGAADFIMKSNLSRLIPAVERELREAEVRRDRRLANQKIKEQHDQIQVHASELEVSNDELKNTQEKLLESNSDLQATLDNLKSSQEQLLQSSKLAAIGELVSGVAHELNNPLAAISMATEMLEMMVDDEEEKECVEVISAHIKRAIAIVGNLLSFARKHEPHRNCISINEAILSTIELRTYELNLDSVVIATDLCTDIPGTNADYNQLQQVFLNLISNAEQAMKEAHGRGNILIKSMTAGDMIRVTFTDDGPGVPVHIKDRLFEPFFTTKEVGKGTGLGLSICYGIIEDHGGRIYVESGKGDGTTFVIELPIVREMAECAA